MGIVSYMFQSMIGLFSVRFVGFESGPLLCLWVYERLCEWGTVLWVHA